MKTGVIEMEAEEIVVEIEIRAAKTDETNTDQIRALVHVHEIEKEGEILTVEGGRLQEIELEDLEKVM